MKKAIVESSTRISCPHCQESRSMMLLIANGDCCGFSVDYSKPGDTIVCVSCNKEFER